MEIPHKADAPELGNLAEPRVARCRLVYEGSAAPRTVRRHIAFPTHRNAQVRIGAPMLRTFSRITILLLGLLAAGCGPGPTTTPTAPVQPAAPVELRFGV